MSDRPATDAEVAALKRLVAKGYYGSPDLPPLIARIESDGERMNAAKALRKAAGEANAELVASRDVLKAFGLLNPALCAYDAALAALEVGE